MVTAGLCRKRPCMTSPSVKLMHASAAQRVTSAPKRVQLGVEPRLDPDEVLLDGRREGRGGDGRGAVGEGVHGGGEATQREQARKVKDGCRRGRGRAPEQPSEAVMVAATLRWREAAA